MESGFPPKRREPNGLVRQAIPLDRLTVWQAAEKRLLRPFLPRSRRRRRLEGRDAATRLLEGVLRDAAFGGSSG